MFIKLYENWINLKHVKVINYTFESRGVDFPLVPIILISFIGDKESLKLPFNCNELMKEMYDYLENKLLAYNSALMQQQQNETEQAATTQGVKLNI